MLGRRGSWRSGAALVGLGLGAAGAVALGSVAWVRTLARGHRYGDGDLAAVPDAPVALVLGAQVYPDGRPSPFLAARLDLAGQLFDAGTIGAVLVSGDHRAHAYDEPAAMRRQLLAAGVPADRVATDHAGLDTYDSAFRARHTFGLDRVLVVTQGYHLARAVATCRALGLDADGVGDETVRGGPAWRRGALRELPACVKTVLDVASHRAPALGASESPLDRTHQS